ncbi:Hsp20/alpha crystallin family protein [Histomonas meleagridis]|uniref:Hsp20/alpha crystallin family protein n=1 Tax=Histomonas meleagridis TaxID=135588 RepID=UPI00355A3898|nr:Hsp20/alpha crystallin family protein [Histomonas meleagridis]KAH0796362.1 Hsp20/alpha crystallin family protein [Histomonas meleagridis]
MAFGPLADIFQTKKGYQIQVELPGVKREDISIDLDQGNLKITATKKQIKGDNVKQIHSEREFGTVSRSFGLPANAQVEQVEASLTDGVLTLSIPKKERSKIEVKIL